MQDATTGLWTVWLMVWHDNNALPEYRWLAENLERDEVDKWLVWGNLSKSDFSL